MHYRLVNGVFKVQAVHQFDVIIRLIKEAHKVCTEEQFPIVSSYKSLAKSKSLWRVKFRKKRGFAG